MALGSNLRFFAVSTTATGTVTSLALPGTIFADGFDVRDGCLALARNENGYLDVFGPAEVFYQIPAALGLKFLDRTASGSAEFEVRGLVGTDATIESTEDLTNWQPIADVTFGVSALILEVPGAAVQERRFYRARASY